MAAKPSLGHNVCQRILGRYALYGEVAHGGMATVHFGRLLGPVGFSRTVAIKRLHPQYAKDPDFVSMFLDEARLAARVRHPNVVPTLDVVALEGELFLVMEYVQGESLSRLMRRARDTNQSLPPGVALAIMSGVLSGLHAAHEATNERGEPLALVHRDMSPQNVLVCVDGIARVLDFGIAKATGRVQTTREGQLKGKLSYIAPEQLQTQPVDRRTDIYAASVTLWEVLTGQRLFKGDSEWQIVNQIMLGDLPPPSTHVPDLPPAVDAIVMKGLARDPAKRFATAREMAMALEQVMPHATSRHVGEWVETLAGEALQHRRDLVSDIETNSSVTVAPVAPGTLADGGTGRTGDRASSPGRSASGRILVSEHTSTTATGSAPAAMARAIARGDQAAVRDVRIPRPARLPTLPDGLLPPSETGSSVMPLHHTVAPPPVRRRRGALVLGALVLGGAVAALLVMTALENQASTAAAGLQPLPPAASTGGLAKAAVTPIAATADLAAIAPPPPAPLAPLASPSAAVSSEPPPAKITPSWMTGRRPASAAKAAAAPSASAAPLDPCSPPYTLDPEGIRHPKVECM